MIPIDSMVAVRSTPFPSGQDAIISPGFSFKNALIFSFSCNLAFGCQYRQQKSWRSVQPGCLALIRSTWLPRSNSFQIAKTGLVKSRISGSVLHLGGQPGFLFQFGQPRGWFEYGLVQSPLTDRFMTGMTAWLILCFCATFQNGLGRMPISPSQGSMSGSILLIVHDHPWNRPAGTWSRSASRTWSLPIESFRPFAIASSTTPTGPT